MTALLYKDLFLLLRQLRWFLLAVLALLLLPLTLFFQQTQLSLVPLIGLLVPIQLAACDEQTHWDHYARMLPYRPRDTVLSRYLISWATTLVGGGLCLARSSLTSPDHHLSPAMLGTIGWLVAAVLLAQAVELPLLFRISVVHGQLWSLLVLLVAILLALNLLADLNPNNLLCRPAPAPARAAPGRAAGPAGRGGGQRDLSGLVPPAGGPADTVTPSPPPGRPTGPPRLFAGCYTSFNMYTHKYCPHRSLLDPRKRVCYYFDMRRCNSTKQQTKKQIRRFELYEHKKI